MVPALNRDLFSSIARNTEFLAVDPIIYITYSLSIFYVLFIYTLYLYSEALQGHHNLCHIKKIINISSQSCV